MIKLSVMYQNQPDGRFDHSYYEERHMPRMKTLLGAACLFYTIDQGLAGGAGEQAPYVAMGHIYFDSLASFQAAFGPHAQEIMADVPNYTNLQPVTQISQVVVGQP